MSGHAFELVVAKWLGDVMRSSMKANETATGESWMAEEGFHSAVKGGRIEYEAVA